jgi:hypothetical protein
VVALLVFQQTHRLVLAPTQPVEVIFFFKEPEDLAMRVAALVLPLAGVAAEPQRQALLLMAGAGLVCRVAAALVVALALRVPPKVAKMYLAFILVELLDLLAVVRLVAMACLAQITPPPSHLIRS